MILFSTDMSGKIPSSLRFSVQKAIPSDTASAGERRSDARVLELFSRRLQDTGHQVLLFHVDSGYTFDAAIPLLAGYRVDAIVSALAVLSEEAAEQLATFNIPVVAFNTAVSGGHIASVRCDNIQAAARLADLFIARGARPGLSELIHPRGGGIQEPPGRS